MRRSLCATCMIALYTCSARKDGERKTTHTTVIIGQPTTTSTSPSIPCMKVPRRNQHLAPLAVVNYGGLAFQ